MQNSDESGNNIGGNPDIKHPSTPIIVGLIGGVCAGKTTVAALLAEKGATIWDADKAVREIQSRQDIIQAIADQIGDECIDVNGQVNRAVLARRVFSNPALLRILTKDIIWPETGREIQHAIQKARDAREPLLVLDAPTLLESGHESVCDIIVYVTADSEIKSHRAITTRGWNEDEVIRRESRMIPETIKKQRADIIIHNNGDFDALRSDIDALWKKLTGTE